MEEIVSSRALSIIRGYLREGERGRKEVKEREKRRGGGRRKRCQKCRENAKVKHFIVEDD